MDSQHDTTEPVDGDTDHYREQLQVAVTALQACDAAIKLANDRLEHGVGYRKSDAARIADAADAVRALLAVPTGRPGSWEASHVEALDEQLRDVLAELTGAGAS